MGPDRLSPPTAAHSGGVSQLGVTHTTTTAIRWADDPGPIPLPPLSHRSLEWAAWLAGALITLAMIGLTVAIL